MGCQNPNIGSPRPYHVWQSVSTNLFYTRFISIQALCSQERRASCTVSYSRVPSVSKAVPSAAGAAP